MLSDAQLAEIRSRINPAYRDWPGCDSHERNLLVGEIDRLRGERKVLADLLRQALEPLHSMLIDSESCHEECMLLSLEIDIGEALKAIDADTLANSKAQSTSTGGA